jgi:hypothetical protein
MENVFESQERGLERLLKGLAALVDIVAVSEDFSYILVHGEHVFRAYSDLHAKLGEHRFKAWRKLLACVEEGIARGDIRRDIDTESLALAAQGAIHMTIRAWIEADFSFDIREACESRIAMIERILTPTDALRSLPRRNLSVKPLSMKPASARAARAKPAVAKDESRTVGVATKAATKTAGGKTASAKNAAAKVPAASRSARGASTADSVKAKPRAKAPLGAKRK